MPATRRLLMPAVALLIAGCGGGSTGGATPSPATTSAPVPPVTTTAATTTTVPASPVTTEQDCPYLATALVQDTVGQQTPTVTTTGVPGGPPPTCAFLKPNGEAALTVEISQAADPTAARTAAVERVAGMGGTAVPDIADGGGIAVGDGQTVLAVADGLLVVVVTVNQESSLQAREIATSVTAAV